MLDMLRKMRSLAFTATLLLSLGLVLTGCSDDDDDDNGPTGPTETEFDQAFAAQQAQSVVPLVIDMVDNLAVYATGVAGKADDYYTWEYVPANGRWEGAAESNYEGFTLTYVGWLQYLDADGNAQQYAVDAASYAFHNAMTMVGAYSDENTTWSLDLSAEENFSATGLQTEVLTVDGDGFADIDYAYSSGGNSSSATYSYSWEILGDGITYPLDGCPVGSMEFTFAPYRVVVTFDGSNTASYTMYQGTTMIPEGSGTTLLSCAG